MIILTDVPMRIAKQVPYKEITLNGIDMSGTGGMINKAFEKSSVDVVNGDDDDGEEVEKVAYIGGKSKPRFGSAGKSSNGK